MKMQREVAIKASKLIKFNDKGEAIVSEVILDDVIKNAQKITSQRNFVVGTEVYNHSYPALVGFLTSARKITSELILTGEMEKDKYSLLSAKTNAFKDHKKLVNSILADLRDQALMEAEKKREDEPNSAEAKEPFTEEQKANIMAEPDMAEPETHMVEETTKDGSKFRFNKIEYELTVFLENGTTRVFQLAPEGSWRRTIIRWLEAFCRGVKNIVVGAKDLVVAGFKRFTGFFTKGPHEKEPAKEVAAKKTELDVVADIAETVEPTPDTEDETVAKEVKPETPPAVVVPDQTETVVDEISDSVATEKATA